MRSAFLAGCTALLLATSTQAVEINLFEVAVNKDGVAPTPVGADFSGLDASGLGSVSVLVSGAGTHSVLAYFDFEITDEASGNTFFDELGGTSGEPADGQSWEIDEPGFVFGNIRDNFLAGGLDSTNGIGSPDDVAMALGWIFDLAEGQAATVKFIASLVQPESGFYLTHVDPASQTTIYLNSIVSVPEPSSLALLGLGLLGLSIARRRRD